MTYRKVGFIFFLDPVIGQNGEDGSDFFMVNEFAVV